MEVKNQSVKFTEDVIEAIEEEEDTTKEEDSEIKKDVPTSPNIIIPSIIKSPRYKKNLGLIIIHLCFRLIELFHWV